MNKKLRSGVTTGASAAAAAQAAVIKLFKGHEVQAAKLINPQGREIIVPIQSVRFKEGFTQAVVIKDGGDDPDITHGLEIIVSAKKQEAGITISGGTGVGLVTKPGLQVSQGEHAINPVPRRMITEAVREYLPEGSGVRLEVSVPRGEEAARKTLNPKLGIEGGISILGTTGIVEPMSEEAFKRSLVPQISMAKAYGHSVICLTPGRLGERWAVERLGVPVEAVVQMSNFVGFMLKSCVDMGISKVLLVGHHSKLTKVAAGCFHTHNKVSDARLETVAAYAGTLGASPDVIKKLLAANTSEQAMDILQENNLMDVMSIVAVKAARRASEHVFGELEVGVVMFTMAGEVLAVDENALTMGRELNWRIISV